VKNKLEIEKSLVGACISRISNLHTVEHISCIDHFTDKRTKEIFSYLRKWNGEKMDLALLSSKINEGGNIKTDRTELLTLVTGKANDVKECALELKKLFQKDCIRSMMESALMSLDTQDIQTTVAEIDKGITQLDFNISTKTGHINEAVKEAMDSILRAKNNDGISGIDTGYSDLNDLFAGWQPHDQIVIGARPGMGKTTQMLNFIENLVSSDVPVALFSLEISKSQVMQIIAEMKTGVNTQQLRKGNISEKQLAQIEESFDQMYNKNCYIFDDVFDLDQILTRIRFLKRTTGLKVVIVDYLQLVQCSVKGNRESQVSMISREFKKIAAECNLTNIILSQLSRSVETRGGNKRPKLSDLRESGAIEQDADIIMFMYRDSYYRVNDNQDNKTELIISKNRFGELATLFRKFENRKFKEIEYATADAYK